MAVLRFIFRFFAFFISVLLVFPLILLFIAISQKLSNRKLNKFILNLWSRLLCFVSGLKLFHFGNIHKNPVLLVANHVSWLDIPVIHSYKLAGFVAKNEISKWPLLGRAVIIGETVFIDRGKHDSRREVLEKIKKRLSQGRSIAIFPEGKATSGDYLGRFHRQLMQAAVETETPIQALAIKYIKPDGKRNKEITFKDDEGFVKNIFRILTLPASRVEVHFCEEIDTKDKTAKQVAMIAQNQVSQELAKNDYL